MYCRAAGENRDPVGSILWWAPREAPAPSAMKQHGTCQHTPCVVLTASIFSFLQELLLLKK